MYETRKDFNEAELQKVLAENLRGEPILRRLLAPQFLRKQLRMAYLAGEVVEIVKRTFPGKLSVGTHYFVLLGESRFFHE